MPAYVQMYKDIALYLAKTATRQRTGSPITYVQNVLQRADSWRMFCLTFDLWTSLTKTAYNFNDQRSNERFNA